MERAKGVLFSLLVALVACGRGEPVEPGSVTVRDSAGVRLVEHGTLDAVPTDTVSDDPLFRIGRSSGDPLFEDLGAGALLAEGGAAVLDAGANVLWVIEPDGSRVTRAAGPGQGPGEVAGAGAVEVLPGDTLVVYDQSLRRLSTFDRGGTFLSSAPWVDRGPVYLEPTGVNASGRLTWLAVSFGIPSDPEEGVHWVSGAVVTSGPLGAAPDTIGRLPFMQFTVEAGEALHDPYRPWGTTAAFRDGFAWARTDRPEVVWYTESGRPRQIIRWSQVAGPVDEEAIEAWRQAWVDFWARRSVTFAEEELAEMARSARRGSSPTIAMFGWMTASHEGAVWLPDAAPLVQTPTRGYLVLAPDGATVRRVVFPRPLMLLDVRDGRALGVERDDWDVQAVVTYRLATS